MFSICFVFSMFSILPMFSKLTACSLIRDGRIPQFLQACLRGISLAALCLLLGCCYCSKPISSLLSSPCYSIVTGPVQKLPEWNQQPLKLPLFDVHWYKLFRSSKQSDCIGPSLLPRSMLIQERETLSAYVDMPSQHTTDEYCSPWWEMSIKTLSV